MTANYYQLNTENGTKLELALFPADQPRGILQIIHGALEYKERYFPFAQFMNQAGYVVVLSDNRGHGGSVSAEDPHGIMMDFQQLVADQVAITAFIKGKYPGLPLTLFGHSFGSIIARNYLQQHDAQLDRLILTGTANYVPVVPLAVKLGRGFTKMRGNEQESKVLNYLSGNLGVAHDWLSNNPENNVRAKEDPKMVKVYPVRSLLTIWEGDHGLKAYHKYRCEKPQLPILNLVGAEDTKITGGSKGIADTIKTLRKIGYQKIESRELPGMKHEILNEIHHQKAYDLILLFADLGTLGTV